MSITIEGVPASIARTQIWQALELLGIDPARVVDFGADAHTTAVYVTVHSDGSQGPDFRWTHDGKNVATHRLTIPITDDEPNGG